MSELTQQPRHTPVLLAEVLSALAPVDDGIYVDATFGAGGYSRAILDAAQTRVFALDRDPAALAAGAPMVSEYAGRLTLIDSAFSHMGEALAAHDLHEADGVVFDLGVSSMQLDEAARGFSFRADGPLDMRMSGEGESAADVVNRYAGDDLAHLIRVYGEEQRAGAVARAIVAARAESPITRTLQLATLVETTLGRVKTRGKGRSGGASRLHPATRTFQALRIHVNRELEELGHGLSAAERLLAVGGRLAVVSFHSLEDRIAKVFLAARAQTTPNVSRHALPGGGAGRPGPAPSFVNAGKGLVRPRPEEIAANPRARSARLRVGERTSAPAHETGIEALPLPRFEQRGERKS